MGEKLRAIRLQKGLKQQKVAQILGIPLYMLSRWEQDTATAPDEILGRVQAIPQR